RVGCCAARPLAAALLGVAILRLPPPFLAQPPRSPAPRDTLLSWQEALRPERDECHRSPASSAKLPARRAWDQPQLPGEFPQTPQAGSPDSGGNCHISKRPHLKSDKRLLPL